MRLQSSHRKRIYDSRVVGLISRQNVTFRFCTVGQKEREICQQPSKTCAKQYVKIKIIFILRILFFILFLLIVFLLVFCNMCCSQFRCACANPSISKRAIFRFTNQRKRAYSAEVYQKNHMYINTSNFTVNESSYK